MPANTGDASSFMQMLRGTLELLDERMREAENAITALSQRLDGLSTMKCAVHDKQLEELYNCRNEMKLVLETMKQDVVALKAERDRLQGVKKDYTLLIWGGLIGLFTTAAGGIIVWWATKT